MIPKQEIMALAAELQLQAHVVEKDYALGWFLAGIAAHPIIGPRWVFKGGTCLKKCYFETYRFSEDLDFSLVPCAAYNEVVLRDQLRALVGRVEELSGLQFPVEAIILKTRQNRQGQATFEGRVGYRGPLAYPGTPKILFDLTQHEPIIDAPAARSVLHPYPDALPSDTTVLAYSFHELLAEKTRALLERCRPRDLYDVVHLLENAPQLLDLPIVRDLFIRKCGSKGLTPPNSQAMVAAVSSDAELRSEWSNMLAHQLPALPELDGMLTKLPPLLAWLNAGTPVALPESQLAAAPISGGMSPVIAAGIRYWGGNLPLETIRFAGSNRLLLEFDYHGSRREAEPYSVRQAASTGNIRLYAWETTSPHIKAFNVAEMGNVRVSGRGFIPRYRVEFSETGPVVVQSGARTFRPSVPMPAARQRRPSFGPKYVFECPHCEKRFTHTTNNPALRAHKRKDDWGHCPGRRGHLVDTR